MLSILSVPEKALSFLFLPGTYQVDGDTNIIF